MNFFKVAAIALSLIVTGIGVCAPASAQVVATVAVSQAATSGTFVKKAKKLNGNWEVVERNGRTFIVFADDFRAANGPDLKVFLSPKTVADVTGKTAVDGSLNLGVLKATKGTQEYEVPAGVDLSNYQSVLVHCEAYAILWGGGDL